MPRVRARRELDPGFPANPLPGVSPRPRATIWIRCGSFEARSVGIRRRPGKETQTPAGSSAGTVRDADRNSAHPPRFTRLARLTPSSAILVVKVGIHINIGRRRRCSCARRRVPVTPSSRSVRTRRRLSRRVHGSLEVLQESDDVSSIRGYCRRASRFVVIFAVVLGSGSADRRQFLSPSCNAPELFFFDCLSWFGVLRRGPAPDHRLRV